MSVDDLFTTTNTIRPIHKRYPRETIDQYVADLKRVLQLVDEGQVMPVRSALVAHFKKTLGMDITGASIGNHIKALQKDGTIWRR